MFLLPNIVLLPVRDEGAADIGVMVVAADVGEAVGGGELDGGVVADVEVVERGEDGADNADVDAVIGENEFAEAGEG